MICIVPPSTGLHAATGSGNWIAGPRQGRRSGSAVATKVLKWRATAEEDGQYCFAVAL
jgi:hypothetical protein